MTKRGNGRAKKPRRPKERLYGNNPYNLTSLGLTARNLKDKAAQAIKERERNRQRDTDVQNAKETSDVTERPINDSRDINQDKNTGVLEEICIDEDKKC